MDRQTETLRQEIDRRRLRAILAQAQAQEAEPLLLRRAWEASLALLGARPGTRPGRPHLW